MKYKALYLAEKEKQEQTLRLLKRAYNALDNVGYSIGEFICNTDDDPTDVDEDGNRYPGDFDESAELIDRVAKDIADFLGCKYRPIWGDDGN